MAEIEETRSIAPVLPAAKRQRLKPGQPKLQQRPSQDKQRRPDRDAGEDGGHHVDEYA
jgi:hypothetical protein